VFVILKTWVATAIRETTVEVVVDEGEEDSDPTVTEAGERAVDMVDEVATRSPKRWK
jgi:predicted fused transcriptional regulator/phosphomethylpyrimidine kinase